MIGTPGGGPGLVDPRDKRLHPLRRHIGEPHHANEHDRLLSSIDQTILALSVMALQADMHVAALRDEELSSGWQTAANGTYPRPRLHGRSLADAERARSFYRDVLGMRADEHGQFEQWAGSTCFVVWEPERVGMDFVAQTGNPLPLRVEDVHAARAELESKGVSFFGETLDTGVCHMAIFADPDGNQLMLHHRYAPYENA